MKDQMNHYYEDGTSIFSIIAFKKDSLLESFQKPYYMFNSTLLK